MKTLNATEARDDLLTLLRNSVKGHRIYRITAKEGGAILLSEEDYENLLETLELLSTPGMLKSIRRARRDIKEEKVYTMKEVFGE